MRVRWATLAVAILLNSACSRAPEQPSTKGSLKTGDQIVSVIVEEPETKLQVDILKLIDRPTIINFWASWCEPCLAELPKIDNLVERYGDKVLVISINMDDEPLAAIKSLKKKFAMKYRIFAGEGKPITDIFGIMGVPANFLVNKEGQIIKVVHGLYDWTEPSNLLLLESLLKAS